MKAMKRWLLLLICSGALAYGAELAGVQSVYVMPMSRGLDQYLTNRLTNSGIFRVVTDPKMADAVFTDRIGEGLRLALEEIAPMETPPPPAKPEPPKDDKDPKGKKEPPPPPDPGLGGESTNKLSDPGLATAFGRGKGTLFLVDAKSRQVLWSTFEAPGKANSKQLDRTALDIVSRLKRDLKRK